MTRVMPPPLHLLDRAVTAAIEEDFGEAGDITTTALVDPVARGRAEVRFRTVGVLAGTWTTEAVCERFDLVVAWRAQDGDLVGAGGVVGEVEGSLADLLRVERTVLNFLSHLSGIATTTRYFVEAILAVPSMTQLRDTRKTLPGLRALEKAAVRAGGGINHRLGLHDAILVKDNHLVALHGDMSLAVAKARAAYPGVPVEVEADTVDQAVAAAGAGADLVLVDNMTPREVSLVVETLGGRVGVEVSGGITLDNVAEYAACGAQFIAVGAITHSAPAIDIGLDLVL